MDRYGGRSGDEPTAPAEELLRLHDAADRLDAVDRKLLKNGFRLIGLGGIGALSVGIGLLVATPGFLGLLVIPPGPLPSVEEAASVRGGASGSAAGAVARRIPGT